MHDCFGIWWGLCETVVQNEACFLTEGNVGYWNLKIITCNQVYVSNLVSVEFYFEDRVSMFICSADETGREAGKNCRESAVRKRVLFPTVLLMLVSFSLVSLFVDCTNETFQTEPKSLCNWHSVFLIYCKDF